MTDKYNIDSPESQALLAEMRSLFSSESKWCKGSNARDANGYPVPILSPLAESWDIMGALNYARHKLGQTNYGAWQAVYDFLKSKVPETSKNKDIEYHNDLMNWSEFSEFLGVFPMNLSLDM